MKMSTMHWALFAAFIVVFSATGFLLGNYYLDKRDEKRLAEQNLNDTNL